MVNLESNQNSVAPGTWPDLNVDSNLNSPTLVDMTNLMVGFEKYDQEF